MKRSRKLQKWYEAHAVLEAQDRATDYLCKFPPTVALATALIVEQWLAIRWEEEQRQIIRRGDPRKAFWITPSEVRELHVAIASLPPGVRPDPVAQQHIIGLLADLPSDSAWWAAHRVVEWQQAYGKSGPHQS